MANTILRAQRKRPLAFWGKRSNVLNIIGAGLPALATVPVVDVFLGLILCVAVTLLDLTFELVALAVDDVKIVVRELAPLFLDLALDLLPVTFDAIPVHFSLLFRIVMETKRAGGDFDPSLFVIVRPALAIWL
jgi:hypothetical protein